ncbi:MAG TPA: SIMPL domain-containing protein [Gammaproteobacteria bacterium]|nr:SIMPL domain-containing protein [Gammaproteobacteria bacterium]
MQIFKLAAVSALVIVSAAAEAQPGQGRGSRAEEPRPTISVSATAQVSADPDRAVVRLGAVAEAAVAADAQSQLNAVMQKVIAAVTAAGVESRALRTDSLSLSPIYRQPPPDQRQPVEPRISGYQASNVVTVELDDIAKVGPVIDAGVQAGANRLQGVTFGLRDASKAQSQALAKAVTDARAQAEAVASAAGLRIEGVQSIMASGSYAPPPVPYQARAFEASVATPIQPGQVDVSASVTATYFVEPK